MVFKTAHEGSLVSLTVLESCFVSNNSNTNRLFVPKQPRSVPTARTSDLLSPFLPTKCPEGT